MIGSTTTVAASNGLSSDIVTGCFVIGSSALTGAVAWVVARTTRKGSVEADVARWHRERIERAFVAFLTAGEACRQAQVDFQHGKRTEEALEEASRALVAARPLLRITASELSLYAVKDYLTAMMAVNRVLTEGGDLEAAREEATTALEEVEIMARREAGLEGGLAAFHLKP